MPITKNRRKDQRPETISPPSLPNHTLLCSALLLPLHFYRCCQPNRASEGATLNIHRWLISCAGLQAAASRSGEMARNQK